MSGKSARFAVAFAVLAASGCATFPANDPALASVLAQAQQYVIGTRPAAGGAVTVFFDAAALERDITAAGRTIWNSERPVLLVVHGIHTLENMKLDVLAAERVQEFAFVVQPLKIKGGTGSTVAPIAIR